MNSALAVDSSHESSRRRYADLARSAGGVGGAGAVGHSAVSGGATGAGAADGGGRPAECADRRRGGGDGGHRAGVADAVRRGGAGQVRASARGPGAQAVDSRGDRGRDRAGDVARDAAGGDALVHPHDGGPCRSQPGHRAPGLAGPRAATASGGDVQAVHRSAVRGETRRRGRPVPEPAGQGRGALLDEKSQVHRTQPSLPMKKGRAGTMTHDYKRHGTTTLFAALDVLTGAVIGQCLPRHRHDEFLVFLRRIQREVPRGLQVHLILDNYATHSHPDVQAWLAKHPRFHLHFTPTSSSWLNLVERWFRNLTDKRLRRGSFNSVADLIAAIEEYLTIHNEDPKPFVWTATSDSILAKVRRGRVALQKVVSQ